MPLYFNAAHLTAAAPEYVAWIDIMGTQASMSRSIKATANFIFKLHTAALTAPREHVRLYPVMDGLYAASPRKTDMLNFIRSVFLQVAEEFTQTADSNHRFMIRGGLAFGPVIHGANVAERASPVLHQNQEYRQAILLGMPMVQAHLSESSAPPFGVAVHESARAFSQNRQEPLHAIWWKWKSAENQAQWDALREAVGNHLSWCEERSLAIGYPPERLAVHRKMATQYFVE